MMTCSLFSAALLASVRAAPVAALLLVSLGGAVGCSATTGEATPPAAQGQLALGTFTSDAANFNTHSFYLDTGREVVVFDAQFTEGEAQRLVEEIHRASPNPIKYVVVTHPNPDKFNGASVFQKLGAKVVASEATKAAIPGVHAYKKYYFTRIAGSFTDATYPGEATIDITFTGSTRLALDGAASIELRELQHAGVSTTQTVAIIPAARALVVGDLVHHKAHAWLEGGIKEGAPHPDLASWKSALDELSSLGDLRVYGGRGEVTDLATAVTTQKAYLDRLGQIVAAYVKTVPEAKAALAGPQAGTHWKNLATRAQQAYPDYAFSYLIEYGVYGLAQSMVP